VLRYGEQEGYPEYVMLIYDGLHYDALAVSAFEGAPEDMDVTVMQVRRTAVYDVQ
jgi:ubiquitin thioesterase OTU1